LMMPCNLQAMIMRAIAEVITDGIPTRRGD
jgi:hypothetical protein